MKKISLCLLAGLACSATAAPPNFMRWPLQPALAAARSQAVLAPSPVLYWGSINTPLLAAKKGRDVAEASAKTYSKLYQEACQDALLSALQPLLREASVRGANVLFSLTSEFQTQQSDSSEEYVCGLDNETTVHVTLRARFGVLP